MSLHHLVLTSATPFDVIASTPTPEPERALTKERKVEMKKMTFMASCRDFFGLKEGQTAMEFGKELKELTDKDRSEIKEGLQKLGYEIIAAPGVPVAA